MTNDGEWINTHGRFLHGELEAYRKTGQDYKGLIERLKELIAAYGKVKELQPARIERLTKDAEQRWFRDWLAKHEGWNSLAAEIYARVNAAWDEQHSIPAGLFNDNIAGAHTKEPDFTWQEPNVEKIEREAFVRHVTPFYLINEIFDRRRRLNRLPIYSMMAADPEKYGFLWFLFVALRADAFEKASIQYTPPFPTGEEQQKFERDLEIVHLKSLGKELSEIAEAVTKKYGTKISASRVSQILKDQRLSRRPDNGLDQQRIEQLNKALNTLLRADVQGQFLEYTTKPVPK